MDKAFAFLKLLYNIRLLLLKIFYNLHLYNITAFRDLFCKLYIKNNKKGLKPIILNLWKYNIHYNNLLDKPLLQSLENKIYNPFNLYIIIWRLWQCFITSIGGTKGKEDGKLVSLRAYFCDKMICFKMAF